MLQVILKKLHWACRMSGVPYNFYVEFTLKVKLKVEEINVSFRTLHSIGYCYQ